MNPEAVESYLAGLVLSPENAAVAAVVIACAIKVAGCAVTAWHSAKLAWRTLRAARARLQARASLKRQRLVDDLADALSGKNGWRVVQAWDAGPRGVAGSPCVDFGIEVDGPGEDLLPPGG